MHDFFRARSPESGSHQQPGKKRCASCCPRTPGAATRLRVDCRHGSPREAGTAQASTAGPATYAEDHGASTLCDQHNHKYPTHAGDLLTQVMCWDCQVDADVEIKIFCRVTILMSDSITGDPRTPC